MVHPAVARADRQETYMKRRADTGIRHDELGPAVSTVAIICADSVATW
jgi:hypothetical protein